MIISSSYGYSGWLILLFWWHSAVIPFLSKVLLFKTLYRGADAERSAVQVSGLSDPLNNILHWVFCYNTIFKEPSLKPPQYRDFLWFFNWMNHLLHVKYLITAKFCMQPSSGTYIIKKNKFQYKYRFEEETSFNTFTFIMARSEYIKFKTNKVLWFALGDENTHWRICVTFSYFIKIQIYQWSLCLRIFV